MSIFMFLLPVMLLRIFRSFEATRTGAGGETRCVRQTGQRPGSEDAARLEPGVEDLDAEDFWGQSEMQV
jgi:hypothetical protein